MSDFNSELPVRTQTNGDVVVKLVDGTTVSQAAAVDTAGNVSTNLGKVGGTATDTNNGTTSAGTQRVTLSSDSTGQVKLATGSNTIGQLTANQSVNTAQVAGTTTSVNTGNADAGTQRVVLASNQPSIAVNVTTGGTDICDYNTAAAVAASGTSTHTYTVTTGKTLTLGKCYATASGKMKITVQVDLGAGLVTKFIGFNSTANPDIIFDLGSFGISVASTKTVAIIRQNNDNQAQDVYSTIIGSEA